jgi:hypothetical protein
MCPKIWYDGDLMGNLCTFCILEGTKQAYSFILRQEPIAYIVEALKGYLVDLLLWPRRKGNFSVMMIIGSR